MKKITLINTILFLTLLGLGYPAQAQKWEIPQSDSYSVIRKVNDTTRLVYSEGKDNCFYLTKTTTTLVPYLFFHSDSNVHVNDFAITNDTVFFCGTRKFNGIDYAAFGYFTLVGFPVCTVRLDTLGYLKSFNKLVVYSIEGCRRIAMTATHHSGEGTMAEVRRLGGDTWEYNVVQREGFKELFDDVTETTEHVIFTSRFLPSYKYYETRIWYLNKPAYCSSSLFLAQVNVLELKKPTLGAVLCHNESDVLITANKTLHDSIFLSQLMGLSYYSSAAFRGIPPFTFKDLEVHMSTTHSDLLVTTQTATSVDSYIYHVREDLFYYPGTMSTHYFADENINSINRLSYDFSAPFIASGHYSITNTLRIYGYKKNYWNCSLRKDYSVTTKQYDYELDNLGITVRNYVDTIPIYQLGNESIYIERICH